MRKLAVTLFLLMNIFSCHALPNNKFDSLVMFGDSLTDNGNLYQFMWGYIPVSPPYFKGHFSNGQVWAEYLFHDWYGEQNTGSFQDYAVGGAGAVISTKGVMPFSLSIELDDYFYWNTYDKPETSLFTIWIGANNYLNGPTNVDAITTSVVDAIGSAVDRLVQSGGNKFLIANLPDISTSPYIPKYGDKALLKELTDVHNRKLYDKVAELREKYPDITIIFLDTHALLQDAMTQPSKYHLTNVTEPCYLGTYSGRYSAVKTSPDLIYAHLKTRSPQFDQRRWQMIENNPELLTAAQFGQIYSQHPNKKLTEPSACNGYLFWDHIHPTTVVHRAIANEANRLINEAGLKAVMPEPGKTVRHIPNKYRMYQ